jgi:MtN3 and saliva related transmembrane protein
MGIVDIIGFVAGALTTGGFLPQLLKAARTKSTKDISLLMYIITATGVTLWLIYGTILMALPIIIANSVALLLICTILILKLKYK